MPPAPIRILIVEDHDDLAEALQVNLKRDGYETAVAWDGNQALTMVRASTPDIIILDLGLRGIDGFTVLERLRADGCWCPVLILSARDADADKVEGFRLGADDYVTKPFRTLELLARIGGLARRVMRDRSVGSELSGTNGGAATRQTIMDDAELPATLAASAIGYTPEELVARFGLTMRQAEITMLLAEGLTNPEIADRLSISRFTARNHIEQILAKLKVPTRGRVAAVLRASYDRERLALE